MKRRRLLDMISLIETSAMEFVEAKDLHERHSEYDVNDSWKEKEDDNTAGGTGPEQDSGHENRRTYLMQ